MGRGKTANNFAQWERTLPLEGESYGGSFTIRKFTLSTLYEEYMKLRNRWSRSNKDLELIRYTGARFRLYRHEFADYVVYYSLETPMEVGLESHMLAHPLRLLMSSKHKTVPSLLSNKSRKRYVTLKVRPPRLMKTQWYFQHDFCDVGLVMLTAATCILPDPWLSPLTNTPCLTIYALSPKTYTDLSILPSEGSQSKKDELIKNLYTGEHTCNKTAQSLWSILKTKINAPPAVFTATNWIQNFASITTAIQEQRTKEIETIKKTRNLIKLTSQTDYQDKNLGITYGLYGKLILSPEPVFPEQHKVYQKVRYNPLLDQGVGNAIWTESMTKDTCRLNQQVKNVITDAPLYLALFGYVDICTKLSGDKSFYLSNRVCIKTPYTNPQLYNPTDPSQGYVIISENFMRGLMPSGDDYIPLYMRDRWIPYILHQENIIEAIASSGPFVIRDQITKSIDVSIGYKFGFRIGGNLLNPKQVSDPCKQPTHPLPAPGGGDILRTVQVSHPEKIGFQFHNWDLRRGMLSSSSIRRMLQDSTTDEPIEFPLKDWAGDPVPVGRTLEERCAGTLYDLLQDQATPPPLKKPRREESGSETEEETENTKLQLIQELQRQREFQQQLKRGFRGLVEEMVKSHRQLALDPFLK